MQSRSRSRRAAGKQGREVGSGLEGLQSDREIALTETMRYKKTLHNEHNTGRNSKMA